MKRPLSSLAVGIALAWLAGCGGGSAYNIDEGANVDHHGNKMITRTLQNESSLWLNVILRINGNQYLDTLDIGPRRETTVIVDDLDEFDTITFDAEFEDGERVTGSFSEDGRTVFSNNPTRAAGTRAQADSKPGRGAVGSGDTKSYHGAKRR